MIIHTRGKEVSEKLSNKSQGMRVLGREFWK